MTRLFTAVDRRPWVVAVLGGTGVTLLTAGALAFLAPPELLDAAVALSDRALLVRALAFFAVSTGVCRLLARRPPDLPEVRVKEPAPADVKRSYLR
jgi:hypothetical protein